MIAAVVLALGVPASSVVPIPPECVPAGVPPDVLKRIEVGARQAGEDFSREINALRAKGVTLENDPTWHDLRSNERAAERHLREMELRGHLAPTGWNKSLILRSTANFVTFSLDRHLLQTLGYVGSPDPENPFAFDTDVRLVDFALVVFAEAARLDYLGHEVLQFGDGKVWTRHRFEESSFFWQDGGLAYLEVRFEVAPGSDRVLVPYPALRSRDPKNLYGLPTSRVGRGCPLETWTAAG